MSPPTVRRPIRRRPERGAPGAVWRAIVLLLAATLAGLPALLPPGTGLAGPHPFAGSPAAAATVAPTPRTTGSTTGDALQVTVTVDDIRPRDPRPGDTLQIVGSLRNVGPLPLRAVQLRVRVGDRLTSRDQLRAADTTLPFYSARSSRDAPDLPVGQSVPLDIRLAVNDLQLGQSGVYPLQVEVRSPGAGGGRSQVGAVSTYLPWSAGTPVDPLRMAWLWPLEDVPRQGPDGALLDDSLAGSLAPEGRLEQSLRAARSGQTGTCPTPAEAPTTPAAGPPAATSATAVTTAPARCDPVPVTYLVDPDLLMTVQTMTQPYQVSDRGAPRPGAGNAAARAWLGGLAAATGQVVALPYADPDPVALTRKAADLGGDVAAARSYGDTVTADLLRRPALQTLAVPPDGPVTDAALDALTTAATNAVVLNQSALADRAGGPRTTPGTRVQLAPTTTSGPLTGLVIDSGLSALLTPDRSTWHGARLAEQRWLAETAMISAELPAHGRTLLVSPPRRAQLDPSLLEPVLADTGRLPWLCPVSVADIAAGQEQCPDHPLGTHAAERNASLAQVSDGTTGPDATTLARVKAVRTDADQLTKDVLRGGSEQAQTTRVRLQRGWLRVESSAWREDRAGSGRLLNLLRDDVAALRSKVSLLTGSVLLTSRNGRISVTVVNSLDQPVTVSVRLRAASDARLSTTQTPVLDVGAGGLLPVDVDARTRTSGRFLVLAQLLDREGNAFGPAHELRVRSTIYGTVALAVTGVAAAVLLLTAAIRLGRRAWRR